MILRDLFLFLSKFVSRDALNDFFIPPTAGLYSGPLNDHSILEANAKAIGDTDRIPFLTAIIFGIDEESIRQRISSVQGGFLFVEYSAITSYINQYDTKIDKMHVGITVASPLPDDSPQDNQLIVMDNSLEAIRTIRGALRADYEIGKIWLPMEASTLTPFHSKALANSYGWTLELNAELIDLV